MLVSSVATLENISPAGFSGRSAVDSGIVAYEPEPLPTQIAYSATRLSYDAEIRRLFFQYRDTETGEVQREIPSREAMKVYEQSEQRREEARKVDTTDESGASGTSRRLEPRIIDGEAISSQRAATPAKSESGNAEISTTASEVEPRRGVTTDQIV